MAGKIYITGDCHGDYTRLNKENFPEQNEMDKDDYVIVCGDAALTWDVSKENEYWLKWLTDKPFTTLFVDGNHENYDLLYLYPIEEWNGGKVHKITDSIFHLMRGQIFQIAGKTFFTFGGARSHDIEGGILETTDPNYREKKKWMQERGIPFRVNHLTWWKEEMPSEEEFTEGVKNLEIHGWEVDYIVTHCCSTSTQTELGKEGYEPDNLTEYLEGIKGLCNFTKWFFGHYHDNQNVNSKEILLYEQMIRIN